MYDTAVDLYNRGSFAAAINQFQLLNETKPGQIGYEAFYRPNADRIRQYLADAMRQNDAERVTRIETLSASSRFSVWVTGNWMARFGEMGLQGTYSSYTQSGLTRVPLPEFKLAAKSFIGGDLGVSVRITDFLWMGASWSQLILTPYAEFTQGGFEGTHKIQDGSLSARAGFVETSTIIRPFIDPSRNGSEVTPVPSTMLC